MPSSQARSALTRRLAARADELTRAVVARLRADIVGYRVFEREPEHEEAIRFMVRNIEALLACETADVPAPLIAETRLLASRLTAHGVSLSAMQHAGRVWGAVVWDAVHAAARRDRPAERDAAMEIGSRIWRHVDLISTTAAHAYLDAVTDRGLLSRQLLDMLLTGRGDTEFAHRLARPAHVRLGAAYVVVLVRGDGVPVEDADERPLSTRAVLDRIVEAARGHLHPAEGSLLLGIRLGDVVALYPLAALDEAARARADSAGLAAALRDAVSIGMSSPYVGLDGLALAYAEARQAVALAAETGVSGRAVALEDVLVDHLLRASPHARRILDAVLAPLSAYDGAHRSELLTTLHAYLAADARITGTARRLTVHPNTVKYRLRRIRELTGYDPRAIDDLVVLYLALKLQASRAAGPAQAG